MRLFRFLGLAIFLSLLSSSAALAQAELDTLFAKLRDPASGAKVLSIEPQIWSIWMQGGTPEQNEALIKATASMNLADFANAEKQLNVLIKQNENFAEAWNKRATLYFLMGRYDDSLADIVRTLDLEPRHFGALSGRGMIYQKLGRDAEALAAFKEALFIHPTMVGPRIAVQQLEKALPDL